MLALISKLSGLSVGKKIELGLVSIFTVVAISGGSLN